MRTWIFMFCMENNFAWFIFNYFLQFYLLLALIVRLEVFRIWLLLIFIEIFNTKYFFCWRKTQTTVQHQPSKTERRASNKERVSVWNWTWLVMNKYFHLTLQLYQFTFPSKRCLIEIVKNIILHESIIVRKYFAFCLVQQTNKLWEKFIIAARVKVLKERGAIFRQLFVMKPPDVFQCSKKFFSNCSNSVLIRMMKLLYNFLNLSHVFPCTIQKEKLSATESCYIKIIIFRKNLQVKIKFVAKTSWTSNEGEDSERFRNN